MINWEVVRFVFYASLTIGAPLCFFYHVKNSEEGDRNLADNSLDVLLNERLKNFGTDFKVEKVRFLILSMVGAIGHQVLLEPWGDYIKTPTIQSKSRGWENSV